MNPVNVLEILSGLRLLKYFPSDECAMAALVRQVGEMCQSEEQVDWLVNRMLKLYLEWPGMQEMRACYCSRHRPKDGINAYSQVYADGIPSEKKTEPLKLAAAAGMAGRNTADPELNRVVAGVARMLEMPKAKAPQYPNPTAKPITQADIDAAVEENRRKRAMLEVG